MTVAYAPPLTGGYAPSSHLGLNELKEAILEGPAYGRTRAATRWHRIRWAYNVLREDLAGKLSLRTIRSFWCGQSAGHEPILTDTPPVEDLLCGTCEGRYAGWARERNWLFTPRDIARPKLCPGSQTMLVAEDPERWNRATCLVCGDQIKMRAFGGSHYYTGSWGAQRHEPGPALIDPCLFHAWRDLTRTTDGRVSCRCEVTS